MSDMIRILGHRFILLLMQQQDQFWDLEPARHASGIAPHRKGDPIVAVAAAANCEAQIAAALRQQQHRLGGCRLRDLQWRSQHLQVSPQALCTPPETKFHLSEHCRLPPRQTEAAQIPAPKIWPE